MGERAGLGIGDGVLFQLRYGHEAHDGVGEEDFFGGQQIIDGEETFLRGDVSGGGELEGELAGDAGEAEAAGGGSAEC